MSSRGRSQSAYSAIKINKKQLVKLNYSAPDELQFIAYSWIEKQGGLLGISHKRLLVFDSLNKILRYYTKDPDPLPTPGVPLPQGKQSISIRKTRNFEFKPAQSGIGKAIVRWSDMNGESGGKKIWNITFNSNQLMKDWILMVNQVLKQGHKKPENRPRVVTKNFKDETKYMTSFQLEDSGPDSRRSTLTQSKLKGLTTPDNTITQLANKKYKEMSKQRNFDMNSSLSQSPEQLDTQNKNFPQTSSIKMSNFSRYETPLPLHNVDSLKTVKNELIQNTILRNPPTIQQRTEGQSKASNDKRNQDDDHKLYINRLPPVSIEQNQQSQYYKQNSKIKNEVLSSSHMTGNKLNQHQNKQLQNFIHSLKQYKTANKNQFSNQSKVVSKQKKSILSLLFQNYQKQRQWIFLQCLHPYNYHEFVNYCQKAAILIVQNIIQILQHAQNSPNQIIHIQSGCSLNILIGGVQFSIQLQQKNLLKPGQINSTSFPFNAVTQINAYSKIINKIKQRGANMLPKTCCGIVVAPFCIVSYKLYSIKCKAIININKYSVIDDPQYTRVINNVIEMEKNQVKYYYGNSLLIAHISSKISNNPAKQNKILQIAKCLHRNQIILCHVEDLMMFCYFRHQLCVDGQIIMKLYKLSKKISATAPATCLLLSIIYSIFAVRFIANTLFTKFPYSHESYMNVYLTKLVYAVSFNRNQQISQKLCSQFINQLTQYDADYVDLNFINDYQVFTSIMFLLNLDVAENTTNRLFLQAQGVSLLKFKPITSKILIQSISQQLSQTLQAIRKSQIQPLNQQYRFKLFKQINVYLQSYQKNWINNYSAQLSNYQSKRSERVNNQVTLLQKYSNLYELVFHFLSLYKQYWPTNLQKFQKGNTFSSQIQVYLQQKTIPNYLSHSLQLNCIKWISKLSLPVQTYSLVSDNIDKIINKCKKWGGDNALRLLQVYQLASTYNDNANCFSLAVEFARLALTLAIQSNGQFSIQSAQRWYLLANLLFQNEDRCQEAIQCYSKSLKILQKTHETPIITSSRSKLFPLYSFSASIQAELTIRLKMIKLFLLCQNTEKCLQFCSICLKLCEIVVNESGQDAELTNQMQIYSTIIRCFQITRQYNKLKIIAETAARRFSQKLATKSLINRPHLSSSDIIRQNLLKMCLFPLVSLKFDKLRKQTLLKMTTSIRLKNQKRFNKKQYHNYIVQQLQIQAESVQKQQNLQSINAVQWFISLLERLPIFGADHEGRGYFGKELEYQYNLYQINTISSRLPSATQSKHLIPTMRAIQSISGVIGYDYVEKCFIF